MVGPPACVRPDLDRTHTSDQGHIATSRVDEPAFGRGGVWNSGAGGSRLQMPRQPRHCRGPSCAGSTPPHTRSSAPWRAGRDHDSRPNQRAVLVTSNRTGRLTPIQGAGGHSALHASWTVLAALVQVAKIPSSVWLAIQIPRKVRVQIVALFLHAMMLLRKRPDLHPRRRLTPCRAVFARS